MLDSLYKHSIPRLERILNIPVQKGYAERIATSAEGASWVHTDIAGQITELSQNVSDKFILHQHVFYRKAIKVI